MENKHYVPMNGPIIESGLQFITRLIDRPSVQGLDTEIFFNKLENTDFVEIKGNVPSGISIFLTRLIAKCIMPLKYNGLDVDVIFINTENQLQVSNLYNVLQNEISEIEGPINVDNLVKKSLDKFKLINCYNYNQFFLTLYSLDNNLLENKKVGLMVVDSISAYYWQQKEELSYNSYLIKVLNIIKEKVIGFRVVLLYTKQFNFESKKQTTDWHEGKKILKYEISLFDKESSNEFICSVKSGKDKKLLKYKIDQNRMVWITNEEDKLLTS